MIELHQALRTGELCEGDLRLVLSDIADHVYHKVPTFFFRMIAEPTGVQVGDINLRVGSTPHLECYGGHIGYGVAEPFRGRRYAARSVVLLVPLARRVGLDPVWITCDPKTLLRAELSRLQAQRSSRSSTCRRTAVSTKADICANAATGYEVRTP